MSIPDDRKLESRRRICKGLDAGMKARGLAAILSAALLASIVAGSGSASSTVVLPGFKSPSGNIKCLYLPGPPAAVWCSIGHAGYSKKLTAYCAQPRIGVDWAGFSLGTKSKGGIECTGGVLYDPQTQHPSYATLAYGKTWRYGAFTCSSATAGVTCRNPKGHGVFVSRESYRLF
jgi:hypothetical protein